MRRLWRAAIAAVGLVVAGAALAHKASDAYLQLTPGDRGTTLRVDVALRDLDLAVDVDADGNGEVTWGEVRAAWPRIQAYLSDRVTIDGCTWRAGGPALERRNDGVYAALTLSADCRTTATPRYRVLAEVDPTHRGILRIDAPGGGTPTVRVLDPQRQDAAPAAGAASAPAEAAPSSFIAEGVHHIVTGYDHVLFLLCLLLPCVMRRTPGGWQPVSRLRDAVMPVAMIVTAFTLAHSITLALAATKTFTLPVAFIEPAIAATIMAAAFDNLRPIFGGRRALVTFAFGLIHGFGFANVLGELELPPAQFAWALLQFNVGLELGQLAIVAVVAALLFAVRHWRGYPRWVIGAGSVAAIAMGAFWLAERTVLG